MSSNRTSVFSRVLPIIGNAVFFDFPLVFGLFQPFYGQRRARFLFKHRPIFTYQIVFCQTFFTRELAFCLLHFEQLERFAWHCNWAALSIFRITWPQDNSATSWFGFKLNTVLHEEQLKSSYFADLAFFRVFSTILSKQTLQKEWKHGSVRGSFIVSRHTVHSNKLSTLFVMSTFEWPHETAILLILVWKSGFLIT